MAGKLILYIACSLDGYIAEADGGIGFLEENPTPMTALGYDAFYASVSTLIMGGTTYRQIANELSPEKWLYAGKTTYVYTNFPIEESDDIKKASLPPCQLLEYIRKIRKIQKTAADDIWLVGGGEIIRLFMAENLIDEYRIYVMPKLLGNGIPLFPATFPPCSLQLHSVQQIDDIAELTYRRRC